VKTKASTTNGTRRRQTSARDIATNTIYRSGR
jgi:hypothetical protein